MRNRQQNKIDDNTKRKMNISAERPSFEPNAESELMKKLDVIARQLALGSWQRARIGTREKRKPVFRASENR